MVILYSTGCPRCNVIKEKLESAKIRYKNISDEDTITKDGIDIVPVLEIDGKRLNFTEANEWINERSGGNK